MLEALALNEPELLTDTGGAQQAGESDTSLTVITKLSDLYDRELVGIIGWAKQIPGRPTTELQMLSSRSC